MKVMIVEDEPLARSRLRRLLASIDMVTSVIEAENGLQARALTKTNLIDVILLDIQMPGESGLEFAKYLLSLSSRPAVILVTAHPEHALEAYAVSPADYIVKPVAIERLVQALNRVRESRRQPDADLGETKISYQLAGVMRQVDIDNVLYFIADEKYVRMVFRGGEALLEQSLTQLEQQYPQFLQRIHRNTIVNWHHFDSLNMLPEGKATLRLHGCADALHVSRREASRLRQFISAKPR